LTAHWQIGFPAAGAGVGSAGFGNTSGVILVPAAARESSPRAGFYGAANHFIGAGSF